VAEWGQQACVGGEEAWHLCQSPFSLQIRAEGAEKTEILGNVCWVLLDRLVLCPW
jgi:hypothetical protein